jgi:hypothetical protein
LDGLEHKTTGTLWSLRAWHVSDADYPEHAGGGSIPDSAPEIFIPDPEYDSRMAQMKWCVTYEDDSGEEQSEEVQVDDTIAKTAAQVRKVLEQEKKPRIPSTKIIGVEEGPCAP